MADTAITKGVKNSWGLLAFARMKGKMQVGSFSSTDATTGEVRNFRSCIFTDPNNPDNNSNKTFVAFSSKMGELSPKEIAEQKESLQVVELESGSYILCRTGANAWEDVTL